jgi:hypothetical protein
VDQSTEGVNDQQLDADRFSVDQASELGESYYYVEDVAR